MSHEKGKALKHQDSKSQDMKTSQRFGPTFIIAGQPTKTCHPSKTALDHPSARQQDKTSLGFGQFDHFQANTLFLRSLRWSIAGVALIDKRDLDMVRCHL